ncbi:MAG TPA: putative beta-lysine N-acetyltransferase [Clostridia bacterium]|nr:putative beta-lysine N-acetyltransferase [Clostridia bacterium]
MTPDFWENIEGNNYNCRILVSPYNKRITVSNYSFDNGSRKSDAHNSTNNAHNGVAGMVSALIVKALNHGLDKVWLNTPIKWVEHFKEAGMKLEAIIPGFYKNREAAYFLSAFLSPERKAPSLKEGPRRNLSPFPDNGEPSRRLGEITLTWGKPEHCQSLAGLYGKVFSTYPFPIFDPGYVKHTMDKNVRYIIAWDSERIVASAAAETDPINKNAELTDFATLPEYRSRGLAKTLLEKLEQHLKRKKYHCLYTIARSGSIGMNKTFQDSGYAFQGILVKNCNISGNLEDMNVWSKVI